MYDRVVVITGASDGIGKAAAALFSQNGWTVVNMSRHDSDVPGIINIKTDVTDEENVKRSFAETGERFGGINCLVNNAGYGISGAIEYTELADAQRQFDVNFFGAVRCIKAALPLLKKRKGRIINISSAASIFAIPFQSFYSASKSSVDVLTKALANEIKNTGVTVCALQLGDTKTSFTGSRNKSLAGDEEYGGMISRSVAKMESDEKNGMSPETVAKAIYGAATAKNQKLISAVGLMYKSFAVLNRIIPTDVVNKLIALLYLPEK